MSQSPGRAPTLEAGSRLLSFFLSLAALYIGGAELEQTGDQQDQRDSGHTQERAPIHPAGDWIAIQVEDRE